MTTEIYFLRSLGGRGEELLEAEEYYGYFAEAVDDDLHRRGGPPLPCLLSFTQGKITHSGTLLVGNKAAAGSKRVNISKIRKLCRTDPNGIARRRLGISSTSAQSPGAVAAERPHRRRHGRRAARGNPLDRPFSRD
ncbi:hypothetical protein [Mesorhizobium caraganae]|uniref:hypothetical protein n=1 Tax=Mesorhizobium caraganae TaxID=483206 RepID=UPI003ECD48FD